MADIPALETEIINFLTNTANATATEKTKLRNFTALAFPNLYAKYLVENQLTDTATNRGKFFAWKTVQDWRDAYRAGSEMEKKAANPPETL